MRKTIALAALLSAAAPAAAGNVTGIWANTGEDKVTQDELRAARREAGVVNPAWDGNRIAVFGARNEVVSFNVILEAAGAAASGVSASFNRLSGPGGAEISAAPASGNGVFDWTNRDIELFYVRYLPIKGLSRLSYDVYDERHVPSRLRRPWKGDGSGSGGWTDRPDHDKNYPDIVVPLELVPSFTIGGGSNQSVWADIYIPKDARPGVYHGSFNVREGGALIKSVPVQLTVMGFTLPDVSWAKTMMYYSSPNINRRYLGLRDVDPASAAGTRARQVRDRHFLLAHRHRIALIGDEAADCGGANVDSPCPEWIPRLDGRLFTAANGYRGPGVNAGNGVYSIGTYGSWSWKKEGPSSMHRHADAWVDWFSRNAPSTDYFLYLIDESSNTQETESWARSILDNPGPGRSLRSLATLPLPTAASQCPSLDIPTSTLGVGVASHWQPWKDRYAGGGRKRFYLYNGSRPAFGSTATEDDGVALRERAWAHYKLKADRWFFWETTYYENYQGNTGQVNVFRTAHTFGNDGARDPVLGETGWNYSNGDGVLLYPGTDQLFPSDSYGVDGPFASLRLKHWRRGIQDADYLAMAAAVDPRGVKSMVDAMVPKAGWEYGAEDPSDPTWVRTDISWPTDPAVWESARSRLAAVIMGAAAPAAEALPQTKVYPNPWRADRNRGAPVAFETGVAGTVIELFSVSGSRLRTLTAPDGKASWDLKDESGERAPSGIYIYVVKASDGRSRRGRLAVVR